MKKILAILVALALVVSAGALAFAASPGNFYEDLTAKKNLLVTDWQGNGWVFDGSYGEYKDAQDSRYDYFINEDGDFQLNAWAGWIGTRGNLHDIFTDAAPKPKADDFGSYGEFEDALEEWGKLYNNQFPKKIAPEYQYLVYVMKFSDDFDDAKHTGATLRYQDDTLLFGSIEIDHIKNIDGVEGKEAVGDVLMDAGVDCTVLPDGYVNFVIDKGDYIMWAISISKWGEGADDILGDFCLKEIYLTNDPPPQWSAYEEIEWQADGTAPTETTVTTQPGGGVQTGDIGVASLIVVAALATGTMVLVSKKKK